MLAFAGTALAMLGAATAADAQVLRPIAGHLSQVPSAAQTAAPPAGQTAAPPATNGYVGESTCVACHDQKYSGTAHGLKSNERTPAANMGCESCHGPGQAHVDAGGDPSKIINFKNTDV